MIGQVLGGKYRIVRLLGEGGMGAVYEGEQQLGRAKRKVAVKTLHAHLSRDPKIKARFEREVGTVSELEHPNTIQVYDFGSNEDGILYIVMEFLQGKSLASLLEKDGAMPADRVERIMQQICGSLEEAHGRGIVHRDLKPDNVVLVDRAGKKDFVKVLDFGIAQRAHETDPNEQKLTQQGTVLGTPPYMSPEQFAGRPIDARSDIYSLGVMAFEMLTGKLPFEAQTAWEWATQHMTQAPTPIESFPAGRQAPPAMRNAIKRALAKLPEDRFQTVAEFSEAFAAKSVSQTATAASSAASQGGAPLALKTEIGAPLNIAAVAEREANRSPGATPALQPQPSLGANVSFPTPAAIPQAPPRERGRGGGRAALLAAAALIAVVSIGAIAFAVRGSVGGQGKDTVFDEGRGSPAAIATSTSSAGGSGAPSTTGTGLPTVDDVPPLSGGGSRPTPPLRPPPQRPATGPAAAASALPTPPTALPRPVSPSSPQAAPPPMPAAPPAPVPPATPAVPQPAKYDGPECLTARKLRALGHPKEAENWALACAAKGGTP